MKTKELLIDRPNKSQRNCNYCIRCTHWFTSLFKYDNDNVDKNSNQRLFLLKRNVLGPYIA